MKTKRLNIVFISHTGDFSGAPKCLLDLASSLDKLTFDVTIIVPKDGGVSANARQANLRVKLIKRIDESLKDSLRINKFLLGLKIVFSRFLYVLRLTCFLLSHRIDVVHVNTSEEIYGALAAWFCGKPIIWHIHEYFYTVSYREKYKFFLIRHLSKFIVCVSNAVAEQFLSYKFKVTVIYNGEREKCIAQNDFMNGILRFAVVGGIQPIKGQLDAISAVKILNESSKPNIKLYLIGDKTNEDYYNLCKKTAFESSAVFNRVVFTGHIKSIDEIYQKIDVLLCPFYRDSFPYSALEALSYAKPIIGYRTLGLNEIIIDQTNGLFVPTGDIEQLAIAIGNLVNNSDLVVKLSRGALESSKRYSFVNFINNFENLYKDSLGYN